MNSTSGRAPQFSHQYHSTNSPSLVSTLLGLDYRIVRDPDTENRSVQLLRLSRDEPEGSGQTRKRTRKVAWSEVVD